MSAHIHHLLDEYVAVHLATNYTDFTQLQVYQVSLATIALKEVEYHGPHRCLLVAGSRSRPKTHILSYLRRSRWTTSFRKTAVLNPQIHGRGSLRSKGLTSSSLVPLEQCHLNGLVFTTPFAVVCPEIHSECHLY